MLRSFFVRFLRGFGAIFGGYVVYFCSIWGEKNNRIRNAIVLGAVHFDAVGCYLCADIEYRGYSVRIRSKNET